MLPFLFVTLAHQDAARPPEVKVDSLTKLEDQKVKWLFDGQTFTGTYRMTNSDAPDLVQGYLVKVSGFGILYVHLFNDQIHSITSKTKKHTWEAFFQDGTYKYSEEKPEFPFKKFEPIPVPDGELFAIEFGDYGIRFAVANETKTEEIPRPEGTPEAWKWYKTEFGSLTTSAKGVLLQAVEKKSLTLHHFSIDMSAGEQKSTISGKLVKGQYGGQADEKSYDVPEVIKKDFRLVPPLGN